MLTGYACQELFLTTNAYRDSISVGMKQKTINDVMRELSRRAAKARKLKISPERRREIAKTAAAARWSKKST